MDFKLVSKNNIGVVFILFFVIFLSQHKTLNFLINTYLGRIFVIFLLLVVSYCHKILGIVFVFLVIISFNNNSSYFEGLTTETQSNETQQKEKPREMVINDVVLNAPKTTINTDNLEPLDASHTINTNTNETLPTTSEDPTNTNETSPTTTEGFTKNLSRRFTSNDFIGNESAIKRGKQSNTIPINNLQRSSKSVSPVDVKSAFKDNFSKF